MPLSLHHYPPPGTHPFLVHAWAKACPVTAGFDKDPQHLPIAEALEGVLEGLSKEHGTGRPTAFTPTVQNALRSPRWGFSDTAIADFRTVLRSYLQSHGTILRTASKQRRHAPLAVSSSWMLIETPQWAFVRSTPEQQQEAAAKEAERQAISAMSYRERRRHYAGGIHLQPTSRGTIVS